MLDAATLVVWKNNCDDGQSFLGRKKLSAKHARSSVARRLVAIQSHLTALQLLFPTLLHCDDLLRCRDGACHF